MKNSKEYAKRIDKFYKRLKQEKGKISVPDYEDPLQALLNGICLEYWTIQQTHAAFKKIHDHFVDENEFRVSRQDEVMEVIGLRDADAKTVTTSMLMALMAIFNRHDQLSLQFLREQGKRQARKELEIIAGLTPFAIDYCFVFSLDGHAIPLNRRMIDHLKAIECVHPESTDEEIQGFLMRQISASHAREFTCLLHADSFAAAAAHKTPKSAAKRKKK